MPPETILLLAILFFCSATLYSSVGQAGASGYLAVMALLSVNPTIMKPTALVLNTLVATITTLRYRAMGRDVLGLAWPFLIGSIPLAFLGGAIHLQSTVFRPVVGVVLLIAAAWLLWRPKRNVPDSSKPTLSVPFMTATATGAGIGLLSGLSGTGGGILLSPVLIVTGWASVRSAAPVAALFILTNSVAAILGNVASVRSLPGPLPIWLAAAFCGGMLGTEIGRRHAESVGLLRLLALILIVAGVKFLLP